MTPRTSKGYKGLGMDGFIARWYAKNTLKNIDDYRKDAQKVAALVADGAPILEIAPGPGYLAIELAKLGRYDIAGLDISETFVEIACQNAEQAGVAIDFRHGDASHMPFEEASFDAIVCRAAFKNFTQPVAALDEMHRVLKPGGSALILDLRKDAPLPEINRAVDEMALSPINDLLTRWIFRNMLLKRANSKDEFREMVARSRFKTCQFDEVGISLQVTLKKQPPLPAGQ